MNKSSERPIIKPIILEKGYNTSGLYAFLTSMFYLSSDSINKILNMDGDDISMSYIQEFFKSEIISRLQLDRSLPVNQVDRFRHLLYSFGWRKELKNDLTSFLEDVDPIEIYKFLFIEGMGHSLIFERVEPKKNTVDTQSFDAIEISHRDLVFTDAERPVINLSGSIRSWIKENVIDEENHNYSYRFKELPYLIPVIIDPKINDTDNDKKVPIDINEAIGFQSMSDPVQKIFTWEIQSIILYDVDTSEYASLVRDDLGIWHFIKQSEFPANSIIDMSDPNVANRIAKQIRAVFYKIK